jgi:dephospho-CoA kinase
MRRFLLVGLTGGIATGKSTVSAMFAHLGAKIIDADVLAREVVLPGQRAHREIVSEFGPGVLQGDGYLDRKAVAALVFADPQKRRRLEEITHPAIRTRLQRILSIYEEEALEGVVIWDAALLFEGGGAKSMDRIVVVSTDAETELRRLVARDGLREADARRRIASQMPLDEKLALADYAIDNSGSRADTARRVGEVYRALLADIAAGRKGEGPARGASRPAT